MSKAFLDYTAIREGFFISRFIHSSAWLFHLIRGMVQTGWFIKFVPDLPEFKFSQYSCGCFIVRMMPRKQTPGLKSSRGIVDHRRPCFSREAICSSLFTPPTQMKRVTFSFPHSFCARERSSLVHFENPSALFLEILSTHPDPPFFFSSVSCHR